MAEKDVSFCTSSEYNSLYRSLKKQNKSNPSHLLSEGKKVFKIIIIIIFFNKLEKKVMTNQNN